MFNNDNVPLHDAKRQHNQQIPPVKNDHIVLFDQNPSPSRERSLPRIFAPNLRQLAQFRSKSNPIGGQWDVVERPESPLSPTLRHHQTHPLNLKQHPSRSRQYCPSASVSSLGSQGVVPSITHSDALSSPSSPEIILRPASLQSWEEEFTSIPPLSLSPSDTPSLPPFDKVLDMGALKIERAGMKLARGVKSLWDDVENGVGKMVWRVGPKGRKLGHGFGNRKDGNTNRNERATTN